MSPCLLPSHVCTCTLPESDTCEVLDWLNAFKCSLLKYLVHKVTVKLSLWNELMLPPSLCVLVCVASISPKKKFSLTTGFRLNKFQIHKRKHDSNKTLILLLIKRIVITTAALLLLLLLVTITIIIITTLRYFFILKHVCKIEHTELVNVSFK